LKKKNKIFYFNFFKKKTLQKINYIFYKNFFSFSLYNLNLINLMKKFQLKRAMLIITSKNIALT
jgi:hypothetical protein